MTRREIIDAVNALPPATVLQIYGREVIQHRSKTYTPVCPSCRNETRERFWMTWLLPHGWACPRCREKGSSVDLCLLLTGHDPKRLDDGAFRELARLINADVDQYPPPPPKPPEPPLLTPAEVRSYWQDAQHVARITPTLQRAEFLCQRNVAPTLFSGIFTHPLDAPFRRPDLREALAITFCEVFPLRSVRGDLHNLTIRPWQPVTTNGKPWKSRCINSGEGTLAADGCPLVYGHPFELLTAHALLLVEGALDHLTARLALPPSIAVLGAFSAYSFPAMRTWLETLRIPVLILPHLDKPQPDAPDGIGVKMAETLPHARIIDWRLLLSTIDHTPETYRAAGHSDLNDLIRRDKSIPLMSPKTLSTLLQAAIQDTLRGTR